MPKLKVATFNVEWMANLFDGNSTNLYQGPSRFNGIGRKPADVQSVCERIAGVIWNSDAEIIGIQEGPKHNAQMETFVREYLDDAYDVYSITPRGRQCNHILVWKDIGFEVRQLPETHDIYRHLQRRIEYYRWGNVAKDSISSEYFTRLPVVLKLEVGGRGIEFMVFHTKSKISDLKRKQEYTKRDKPKIISALRSRQKLSAEMYAIRRYLTHAIKNRRTDGCILVGDLNDGPHRDVFEEQFLIHNIVDELRGGFHRESALMHHALPEEAIEPGRANAYTAKFSDPTQDGRTVKVLLDHVLVTTDIRHGTAPLRLIEGSGKIEHEVYDYWVSGTKAHQRPSDHRPVSAEFRY